MLSGLTVSRVATAATLLALVPSIAGCSGGSGGGSGGTGLEAALSRIADTASNRSQIYYDDTAELVRLAGASPTATKGFALLRGTGAPVIAELDPAHAGLNIYGEDYAVTAGDGPKSLTLLAGGQNAATVASSLTKLGWKHTGGKYLAPPISTASSLVQYVFALPQVQASGSDVLVGGAAADLTQIGAPSGPTLASDPGITSLANCLGTVVAAEIFSGGRYPGSTHPSGVSVGISQPASNTATAHSIVCVSWPTQAAAAQYTANLHKALTTGRSAALGKPYSALLKNSSVTVVGGGQHVVEWQANVPGQPYATLGLAEAGALPAL